MVDGDKQLHDSTGRAIDEDANKRKTVFWIAFGILTWGVILAIGDFLANHDYRRPLIIIASVVIFVGFWLYMLRLRPTDADEKSSGMFDSNDSSESRT